MTHGVKWLASYPKSGNTWARLFLLNWFADLDEPINPNDLVRSGFCPSCDTPRLWEEATGLKAEDLNQLASFKLRHHVQWFYQHKEHRLSDLPAFLKTHSSNMNMGGLFPFINWDATSAAIYIIRDPRQVAPSFADHMGFGIDEAINSMADEDYASQRDDTIFTFLESWSSHVNGWKKASKVIRFEDLPDAFEDLLKALGLPVDERLNKAKEFTSLDVLKRFEADNGFVEAVDGQTFFGGKRRTLTQKQCAKIEETHKEVMREFGYL